ncbi:MAG: putative metal-binding motif-containing protein [Sandaracinaceae bacterium]|nr:putative metal-binding motif-containing protein [Sandaracinaceae bacterium]
MFGASAGFYDVWVARYNSAGTRLWAIQFGTAVFDSAYAASMDGSGGLIVVGDTAGSLGGPTAGSSDGWIAHLDAAGNQLWTEQLGSTGGDSARAVTAYDIQNVFVGGSAGANLGGAHFGGTDAWIAKFDARHACSVDADLDGTGAGDALFFESPCTIGYSSLDGDCDDANTLVYPGAPEICDGLDNDCNGTIDDGFLATYCTAGTTVQGCVPSIGGDGVPSSISGGGFDIVVSDVPTQRVGLIFYGLSPTGQSWGLGSSSYLCIFYPVLRTGAHNSGGSVGACDGELRVDFNAFMAAYPAALGSPFTGGGVFYAQGWFRDPSAAKQTNLSDGLRFTLCD